ncbi:phasin [Hansschlegelia beijingensis]|uniref:Phasin n=1 Tax=Hansschlegelia beijingensis TaxID=1133344 RepID=A0A7W6D5Q2_9HYPH|nr:phasin [Hansschlegelia beijingensis]MBB3974730.1 phasin [Hansschlegelia beijingensis]
MATTQKTASKAEEMVDDAAAAAREASEAAPAAVRELADKTLRQAKDGYARLKSVAEEASDALEDAYATTSKSYKELGRKSVEATRSNVNAHFDFLQALLGAKSVSQAVELQASYARQQFDVMTGQLRELSSLAQKATAESAKPFRDLASRSLRQTQI